MTIEKSYKCNVCEEPRKEANHWFVGWVTFQGFRIVEWAVAEQAGTVDDDGAVHICGQKCAHALLDQFLSNPVTVFRTTTFDSFLQSPLTVIPEAKSDADINITA